MSPSRGNSDQSMPPVVCETPEQISTPDEPPPSVHPALLADDEFRSVHIAQQTTHFHRELCRRLEQFAAESESRAASRKRKRGSDASERSVLTVGSDDARDMRRSDTQDSCTTATTTASTMSTAPSDSSKRLRYSDSTTPLSSVSPHSVDDTAKATDLSWWRPLSPSPPASPKMGPTRRCTEHTGSGMITGYG